MTSKIKQGMHLRQPENSSDGAWIFRTLAAMLACAALMFALAALAGFRTGNLLPILLAAGGYVCIAYGVTIRFQKQQWFFLAALVILLLLVLICRQQVLEGYRLFWNQMRNTYTAGTDRGTGSVSIQNIGACSAYQYVPFSLRDTGNLPAENLKEDSLPSDGERTYRYSVVTSGGNGIEQTLSRLQTSDDAQVLQYRRAESAYRSFVYRNYLQVPESMTRLLGKYWDEIAAGYGSRENLTLPQAQACTLTFLSRCFPEEGTPEDMELPLTAAEGTSFQYATVAVMTLRYFGIPARYAEGYVISEEMAADAQADEPLTVDSRCARAWAEVYQDGIGWIPMELTPGLGEMLEQKPEENPDEGDSDNAESETQPEEETTPEEDGTQEPEPDGGTVTKIAKAMLLGVLWVLLIVLLLFLLLLLRRKLIRKRREQKYQLEDINEAVCWIFADTAALMEKLGLRRGNGSMRTLCEPAKQRFGGDYATALAEAIRLNDRAMFSSHALTQEQRESALKFYADTQESLKKNVKWYHRVWIKWIQCLY